MALPGPALNPVLSGDALTGRLATEFQDTWKMGQVTDKDFIAKVMRIDMGYSEKLTETKTFAFYEDAPVASIWAAGVDRKISAFRARQFSAISYRFQNAVEWNRRDRLYTQVDLISQARRAGDSYAALHDRIGAQMITQTADADLLPALPNAADGAAFWSALNGDGNNRYGVAGGNIVAQTGVTAAAVRADFYSALERIARFVTPTSGQPVWNSRQVADSTFYVAGRSEFLDVFLEAFRAQTVWSDNAGAGAGAAGVTNIILAGGQKVVTVPWNRIAAGNSSLYVFMSGASIEPPMFHIQDSGLQVTEKTALNSDRSVFADVEGVYWVDDRTYGLGNVYQSVVIQ